MSKKQVKKLWADIYLATFVIEDNNANANYPNELKQQEAQKIANKAVEHYYQEFAK